MTRTPEELWQRLVDEAGDDLVEQFASMDAEQAETNLVAAGFDLADEHAKAAKFLGDLASGALAESPPAPAHAPVYVAQAVPQQAAPRFERSGTRRRPRAPVVWLAAAAATAAVAGGVAYVALHEEGGPQAPPPAPSPAPTESAPAPPPDLVAASDLRYRANLAYEQRHPSECLALLDQAKKIDPAGDMAPAIADLRRLAVEALANTPLKPRAK